LHFGLRRQVEVPALFILFIHPPYRFTIVRSQLAAISVVVLITFASVRSTDAESNPTTTPSDQQVATVDADPPSDAAHAKQALTKIVLIPTQLDHPWTTHMYPDVCRILAACLNKAPRVQAVVSPDFDWPKDEQLLQDAQAIVYYSRPAGDIVLSAQHREQAEAMLRRGVGFTAIHWATAAEESLGPRYEQILGGWFNFAFCGLKVDQRPLIQTLPDHPVCRGWSGYDLRDEFYLNLKFSPQAQPVLKVQVEGQDQTVAWVQQRSDGGRSFGTTLGHFHSNFSIAPFRRMLANGILWTAGIEVPATGADVELDRRQLELPPQPKPAAN
jgi:type 1 glutamine amidotransferase